MGFAPIGPHNFSEFLQNAGIVTGFFFSSASFIIAIITLHRQSKSDRVTNLIKITEVHREIWSRHASNPELSRIKAAKVDLIAEPVTAVEERFMSDLINHFATCFYARKSGVFPELEALPKDIQVFLSLPVPLAVWQKVRAFQNRRFRIFVETCLGEAL